MRSSRNSMGSRAVRTSRGFELSLGGSEFQDHIYFHRSQTHAEE